MEVKPSFKMHEANFQKDIISYRYLTDAIDTYSFKNILYLSNETGEWQYIKNSMTSISNTGREDIQIHVMVIAFVTRNSWAFAISMFKMNLPTIFWHAMYDK